MKDLEYFSTFWLRFEKRCPVILTERSPRPHHGNPDVLGITQNRFLLEIEIKRSLSDFRANAKKPHIAFRDILKLKGETEYEMWPRQYWYCCPHDLAEKIQTELPDWAGLLRGPSPDESQGLLCVVKAPVNNASKRLTTIECVRLAKCMSNQIFSMADSLRRFRLREIYKLQEDDWGSEYRI